MVISIGGYIINLSVYQAFFKLIQEQIFSQILLWQLSFIPGILLNLGAASNALILYSTSKEYHKSMKQYLFNLAIHCGFKKINQVTAVAPIIPSTIKSSNKKNIY
ncbi:unnamed protein product [Meloidogyne enterolobii]|uniref:Uncharacterized protein n=1 Tax=Meloidogyne enterolobii TaxID=390850 RepID=A0ACB1AX10_MELEN